MLPEVLRQLRRQRGWTIRDASARVGGCRTLWASWEGGAVPSPAYLARLASLLDCTLEQMRDLAGPDKVRRAATIGDAQSTPLAQWRAAAGMTSAEFARRMHISESLASHWQSGSKTPSRQYWSRIAAVLGVEVMCVADVFKTRPAPSERTAVPGLAPWRTKRGQTQRELARDLRVDVSTVQRWERLGEMPARHAAALAEALAVDLAELAEDVRVVRRPRPVSRLRRMRLDRGLPTAVAAARVGVTPAALLAWERGDNKPSWRHARSLATVLGVPVGELFSVVGLEPPRSIDGPPTDRDWCRRSLRELRRWEGISAAALAAALGVAESTVLAWECGRHRPHRSRLVTLATLVSRA